jgi:hypothetical protein
VCFEGFSPTLLGGYLEKVWLHGWGAWTSLWGEMVSLEFEAHSGRIASVRLLVIVD